MDKFAYLLKNASLYFPRSTVLTNFDKKEGALTHRYEQIINELFTSRMVSDMKRQNVTSFSGLPFKGRGTIELRDELRYRARSNYRFILDRTYVNCWHVNDDENYLMWQSYIRNGPGVAIKTTTKRLELAMAAYPQVIESALVEYVDHANAEIKPERFTGGMSQVAMDMLCKKMKAFQGEHEFRIVADVMEHHEKWSHWVPKGVDTSKTNPIAGLSIPVDLDLLIETVVLQPGSDWNFKQQVLSNIQLHTPSRASFDFFNNVQPSSMK